jgi:hypothetical protein
VKNNQKMVASALHREFDFWNFLSELIKKEESDLILILRCSLQLVGNLLVGQTDYQVTVFSSLTSTLEPLFSKITDSKCLNFACMIILTLQKNCENLKTLEADYYKKLASFLPRIKQILEVEESSNSSDFAQLCFELFLENPDFLATLASKERVSLVPNLSQSLSVSTIELLSTDFTFLTDTLLTTTMGSVSQLDPTNILALTHLLSESSGQDQSDQCFRITRAWY